MEESLLADKESIMMGIASRTSSGQRVVVCSELQRESKYQLEQADLEVLLRIVEAEAGCEDEDGKLLVANVILNRLNSEKFPDSITEIVFQRENGVSQFSPIADGSYYKVSVSEETVEAVGRALAGEDISRGALYFAARKYADSESMRWVDEKLTLLFRHGGHEFFSDKKSNTEKQKELWNRKNSSNVQQPHYPSPLQLRPRLLHQKLLTETYSIILAAPLKLL